MAPAVPLRVPDDLAAVADQLHVRRVVRRGVQVREGVARVLDQRAHLAGRDVDVEQEARGHLRAERGRVDVAPVGLPHPAADRRHVLLQRQQALVREADLATRAARDVDHVPAEVRGPLTDEREARFVDARPKATVGRVFDERIALHVPLIEVRHDQVRTVGRPLHAPRRQSRPVAFARDVVGLPAVGVDAVAVVRPAVGRQRAFARAVRVADPEVRIADERDEAPVRRRRDVLRRRGGARARDRPQRAAVAVRADAERGTVRRELEVREGQRARGRVLTGRGQRRGERRVIEGVAGATRRSVDGPIVVAGRGVALVPERVRAADPPRCDGAVAHERSERRAAFERIIGRLRLRAVRRGNAGHQRQRQRGRGSREASVHRAARN